MYFVYRAGLCADGVVYYSTVRTGWFDGLNHSGCKAFDEAKAFPDFEAADEAAKSAGWKRYVILQIPIHCECRAFDESLLGDPDEHSEEF